MSLFDDGVDAYRSSRKPKLVFKGVAGMFIVGVVIQISIVVGLGYVIYHFISKFW